MQKNQIEFSFQFKANRSKSPLLSLSSASLGIDTILGAGNEDWGIRDVPVGSHKIILRLINKTNQDTLTNEQGQIIDDLYVTIESIKIDGIEIRSRLNDFSTYTNNQGQPVQTHGFLCFNTAMEIYIQTPGMYFLRNLHILSNQHIQDWISRELVTVGENTT